jgi:hypothetical protein
LDSLRINFLKDAFREERRWARSLEAAAKKHGVAMDKLARAAERVSMGRTVIAKLVSLLQALGAGALGAALQALSAESSAVLASMPSLGAMAGIAVGAGVGAYAARTLGRTLAARPDVAAFTTGLTEVTSGALSVVNACSRVLARSLNVLRATYNATLQWLSDWYQKQGLRGTFADLERVTALAQKGIQEGEKASADAQAWLKTLAVNVVQKGWEPSKAEKTKIIKRIDFALSQMRLAAEAYEAVMLRSAGAGILETATQKLTNLTLRGSVVQGVGNINRGQQVDRFVAEWRETVLRPPRDAVVKVKEELEKMDAVVTEFLDILE